MGNSLKLGEVAIADIIAKLQNGWAARATEINLQKADSLPIQAPDAESYYTGRMNVLVNVPAVFVLEGKTVFVEEGAHALISQMIVRIMVVDAAETGPRLAVRLQRQVRAIIEVLYDDPPQEQTTDSFQVRPLMSIPGKVFEETGPDNWRSYYEIDFRVMQVEL